MNGIKVSPARFSTFDTEVRVLSTYTETVEKLKKEITDELEMKFRKMESELAGMKQEWGIWRAEFGSEYDYLWQFWVIHNIEDGAINWMTRVLGLLDKTKLTFKEISKQFLHNFKSIGVLDEDLRSLADTDVRDCANSMFHVKKDDIPNVERLSKSIRTIPESKCQIPTTF